MSAANPVSGKGSRPVAPVRPRTVGAAPRLPPALEAGAQGGIGTMAEDGIIAEAERPRPARTAAASRPRPSGPRRGRTIWRGCRRPRSVSRHGVGRTALRTRAAREGWRRLDQPWTPPTRLDPWDEGRALEDRDRRRPRPGRNPGAGLRRPPADAAGGDARRRRRGPALAPRRSGHGDRRGRGASGCSRRTRPGALPPPRAGSGSGTGARSGLIGLTRTLFSRPPRPRRPPSPKPFGPMPFTPPRFTRAAGRPRSPA
jgi:hypothetical protein